MHPPSPRSSSLTPDARASFFMHVDNTTTTGDSFYHTPLRKSADLERGCLLPSTGADVSDIDAVVPDLTRHGVGAGRRSRRGIYAAYRRWFRAQTSRSTSSIHLPISEKDLEPAASYRGSMLERRLQTGSWIAMVVLLTLTIYFFMRET